jgi:hypothetical protein
MELAITILALLAKYGPDVAEAAQRIFATGRQPTPEDWAALFAATRKSYDQYIAEAEARASKG